MKYVLLALTSAAAAFAPVDAQAPISSSATNGCEIHVFPAERFQAMTTGWGAGFGALGALADSAGHANGDKARRSHLASALDSEGQLAALADANLATSLGHAGATVITHNEALDPKTVNKILTRRAASTSTCYSELIVTDVFYQKAAVWGRSLRTSFMLREFGAATANPIVYKTTGGNGLKFFPAKEGTDTTAADAELVNTFRLNFTEAAQNFAKKRKA
ncbi:MAG: hypothetical protein ABIR87_04320 [Sphingomicrobium sp.]